MFYFQLYANLLGGCSKLSKPKILLITQNFYPEIGSAANRMKNIFQLLESDGYDVSVLTTEPSYPNRKLYLDKKFWNIDQLNTSPNVNRIRVKNRKYSFSIFNRLIYYLEISFKMLKHILTDKTKYNTVIVTSPPIFVAFVGMIAKAKYKSKVILDVRDLWPESLKGVGVFNYKFIIKFFSLLEKHLYKKADYIIINSMGFKDYIIKKAKISSKKILFIPNAAREDEVVSLPTSKKQFKVIYTGNIGLAQDVDFLKDLVMKLNKYNIKLTIVGYGIKKNELIEFINRENLQNVEVMNPTTREECLNLNIQHDVGVLSLNNKDVFDTVLPGKLIDYMLSGLPVVGAVSGFSKELIENYHTGYVSENRDSNEIVKYILYLKNNPKVREEMTKNSIELIMSHFSWDKNIKKLTTILEKDSKTGFTIQKTKGTEFEKL